MWLTRYRHKPLPPEALLAVGLFGLAIALRGLGFGLRSGDFQVFLQPWSDFIRAHDGFPALRYNFADYNVPYLYVLVGLTWLDAHTPLDLLTGIKLVSALFDGVLAFYVYRLVALRGRGRRVPLLAAVTVLLLPTVVLNGSYWGQCDSIYTALAVAGLYYVMVGRPWLGCLLFGVAFAVKLQAIFLFPVLAMLVLARHLPWRHLLAIPAVTALLAVPAWLAGRPLGDLLTIYVRQSGHYQGLTYNAPTIYTFVRPMQATETVRSAGILFALAAVLVLFFVLLTRRVALDRERIILLAAVATIMMPFLLPSMHERYFFPAEVLTVVVAFWLPRRAWYLPLLIQFPSFLEYQQYLFRAPGAVQVVDLRVLSLLVFAAWAVTTAALLRDRPPAPAPRPRTPEKTPWPANVTERREALSVPA